MPVVFVPLLIVAPPAVMTPEVDTFEAVVVMLLPAVPTGATMVTTPTDEVAVTSAPAPEALMAAANPAATAVSVVVAPTVNVEECRR